MQCRHAERHAAPSWSSTANYQFALQTISRFPACLPVYLALCRCLPFSLCVSLSGSIYMQLHSDDHLYCEHFDIRKKGRIGTCGCYTAGATAVRCTSSPTTPHQSALGTGTAVFYVCTLSSMHGLDRQQQPKMSCTKYAYPLAHTHFSISLLSARMQNENESENESCKCARTFFRTSVEGNAVRFSCVVERR